MLKAPVTLFAGALALGSISCSTNVAEPSGFLNDSQQLKRDKSVAAPDYEYRSEKDLPVAPGTRIYVAPVQVKLRHPAEVEPAIQKRLAS